MEDIIRKIISSVLNEQLKSFIEEIRKRDEIPEVLTLPETAKLLRVSNDWLRKNINNYSIPYFKTGCDYKFRKKNLFDWMDSCGYQLSKTRKN